MPASVGPFFFQQTIWSGAHSQFCRIALKRKHDAKTQRWLGAGCALALICVVISPHALAQTSSASSPADAPKAEAKTTASRKHRKVTATGSKAKSFSAATKPASNPAVATKSKSSAAAHGTKSKYASSRKGGRKKTRGQQKIDSERAQEIQDALIREHYLSGEASGTWNQASEDAMRRYQADHGWQSKTVPDSRALISLGLGPSHDHLLNPESAMTTGPSAQRASTLTPASHNADPGAKLSTNPAAPAESSPAAPRDKNGPNPQ